MFSLHPDEIPADRGWDVLPVFENPSYSEFVHTLRAMERDPHSPGLSDVGMRNLLFTHTLNLRPRAVLELGTHIGMAAAVIGQALKLNGFGKLYTIEPRVVYADLARLYMQGAGVDRWVEVLSGYNSDPPIQERLAQVGPFELIYIDANHDYVAVKGDIERCWPLLAGNGLMFFHDTGLEAAATDSAGQGGVRRAVREAAEQISDWRMVAYEWPLWLNPWGTVVAWKRAAAPRLSGAAEAL